MKTNAKVYVMVDGEGRIKLGHSNNPARRSKQMVRPVTLVHETDVIEEAERVERLAHRILALHGKHLRGEWFEATVCDAIAAIEIAVRQAEQEELALGGRLDGSADIVVSVCTSTFSIRTENERGQKFLANLDAIRKSWPDSPDRTDVVIRLVADEAERLKKKPKK